MASPTKASFRHPIAIIEWHDAHARNQAVEYDESEILQVHRPEPCLTLGLVIRDDAAGVSLYNEETGPDSIRGLSFIPRGMIISITYVTLTKPRGKPKEIPSPT